MVFDRLRRKVRPATPDDPFFCARRVWDQGTEHGFMRSIENQFQRLVEKLIADPGAVLVAEDEEAASRFIALWHCRAAYKQLPDGEAHLKVVDGTSLTKDQEELLESRWTGFVRPGGNVPLRVIYGLCIRRDVERIASSLQGRRWGVLTSDAGELIVPDVPQEAIIPVTPSMCLACGSESGPVGVAAVRDLNNRVARVCREYWFCRATPDLDEDIF